MYIRKKTKKKRNVSQNIRMDVVQLNTSNSEARRPVQIPPSSTSPIHSGDPIVQIGSPWVIKVLPVSVGPV